MSLRCCSNSRVTSSDHKEKDRRPVAKGVQTTGKGKLLNRIAMRIVSCIFASMLPLICAAQQFSAEFVAGPRATTARNERYEIALRDWPNTVLWQFCRIVLGNQCPLHRLGATDQSYTFHSPDGAIVSGTNRWNARAIEIPLLLKYHFLNKNRTWRPFLSAGPTLRRTSIDHTGFWNT